MASLTLLQHDVLTLRTRPPVDLLPVLNGPCSRLASPPTSMSGAARGSSRRLLFGPDRLAQCRNGLTEGLVPPPNVCAAFLLGLNVVRFLLGGRQESGFAARTCARGGGVSGCGWGVGRGGGRSPSAFARCCGGCGVVGEATLHGWVSRGAGCVRDRGRRRCGGGRRCRVFDRNGGRHCGMWRDVGR